MRGEIIPATKNKGAERQKVLEALVSRFLTDEWKRDMAKIRECQECGHCREQCPCELDTPALLKMMLADYEEFLEKLPQDYGFCVMLRLFCVVDQNVVCSV